MAAWAKDLTGQRFGRLTVIGREMPNYVHINHNEDGTVYKTVFSRWRCRCDCGNEVVVVVGNLKGCHTRSCGCLLKELHGRRRARGEKEKPEQDTENAG